MYMHNVHKQENYEIYILHKIFWLTVLVSIHKIFNNL